MTDLPSSAPAPPDISHIFPTEAMQKHQDWLDSKNEDAPGRFVLETTERQVQNADLSQWRSASGRPLNLRRADLRGINLQGANLAGVILRDADLQDAVLTDAQGLLSGQLGGANLCGAELPEEVARFEGLELVKDISENAGKLFVSLLSVCAFVLITILSTTDADFFAKSGTTTLPLVQVEIPTITFAYVSPLLLLGMYVYFHLNLQRLWEALADLPAVFPDGRRLDQKTFPWLLNDLVRYHFWQFLWQLRDTRPPLSWLQYCLSVSVAWWLIPLSLVVIWERSLTARNHLLTYLQILAIIVVVWAWLQIYGLAKVTLRQEYRWLVLWNTPWKNPRLYWRALFAFGFGVGLFLFSQVKQGNSMSFPVYRILGYQILTTAHMPYANLENADLDKADLEGADLDEADLGHAHLDNAKMEYANLNNANLNNADLDDVDLDHAHMKYTYLESARLEGTQLIGADLEGDDLKGASLDNVDLTNTNLDNAHLEGAHFNSVNRTNASFYGAYYNVQTTGLDPAMYQKFHMQKDTTPTTPSSSPDPSSDDPT